MGTRNLTIVIKDNKLRLSQYGQWDGYFRYTGVRFLKFVKENLQGNKKSHLSLMQAFGKKIDLLKSVGAVFVDKIVKDTFAYTNRYGESDTFIPVSYLLPQFSRDTGVNILNVINGLYPLDFGKKKYPIFLDSNGGGFCEYANVIDMDTDEIYMLTCHEFTGESYTTCPLLDNIGMSCYYKSKITDLPSIKKITEIVKNQGIEVN